MELIIECISSPQTHACRNILLPSSFLHFLHVTLIPVSQGQIWGLSFSIPFPFSALASCSDWAIGEGLLLKACVCVVVGFKPFLSGELGLLFQFSLRSSKSPFSSEMLFSWREMLIWAESHDFRNLPPLVIRPRAFLRGCWKVSQYISAHIAPSCE